jgi:hypothetical protein
LHSSLDRADISDLSDLVARAPWLSCWRERHRDY